MNNKINNHLMPITLIIDLFTLIVSYLLADNFCFYNVKYSEITEVALVALCVYTLISVFSSYAYKWINMSLKEELYKIFEKNFCFCCILLIYIFVIRDIKLCSNFHFVMFFVINFVLTFVVHIVVKQILVKSYIKSDYCERVFLITDSSGANDAVRQLIRIKNWYFKLAGIAIIDKDMKGEQINGIDIISDGTDYIHTVLINSFDSVVISNTNFNNEHLQHITEQFVAMGVVVHISIPKYDYKIAAGRKLENLGLMGVVTYKKYDYDFWQVVVKKFIDIIGGIVGVFLFGVAMIIVGPLIKLDSKGPILFTQKRIGKNGRRFDIYKFRTMCNDAEAKKKELMSQNEMQGSMFKMKDDPRITRIGKFLRKTSIDELPQFINVLKGDMSLVGTRPPTEDEFFNYEPYQRRRVSIKPGITGLWQVSGRSSITDFDDIVKLDCAYIDNWTILKDIKILFKTVWVVLFGRGAE
ncbi:MAG: sugar transferase [Lachnospiraceae bacterium]|nr:sugar transferase [Lachnospiraceae bacterium]